MKSSVDHLAQIVERKRREVERRLKRAGLYRELAARSAMHEPEVGITPLRRPAGAAPRVIAEIKLRSPSAGEIRPRAQGELVRIARGYERAGAAAISVLCDGPGFGGSVLDLRRVAERVDVPVLFKEFVLDEVQLDLAQAAGARLVLLLVRVLSDERLAALIAGARARGLEPVVEAADADELTRALALPAMIVGVNARDLRSFGVNPRSALELIDRIPAERVAVFMSGVRTPADFAAVAQGRTDAVLIGEGLMRAPEPGAALRALLETKH
jgi:indole-3-glycerol phosphate synthase